MKKMLEKHGKLRCVGAGLDIIAIVLFIIAAFLKSEDVQLTMNIIGFVSFLIGGFMIAIQAEEHKIAKLLGFLILTVFISSWIFPYGYFSGVDFYNYGMRRMGIFDLSMLGYYGAYFSLDKLVFLLVVAGFYGVISKISGYQKLVTSLAKNLKKHEIITSVIISLIVVALTSLLRETLIIMIFIPFFVAILTSMKIDKLTTFAITFGSVLIGILGATYGTDSLYWFNQYLSIEITVGLSYRFIILLVAFFLYNFFICMRLKKVSKEKSKNEDIEDVAYAVEPTKAKGSAIPVAILLVIIAIIVILGYVDWTNFGIECFNDFHEWLVGLSIGEDFNIIADMIGFNAAQVFNTQVQTNVKVFGSFDLTAIQAFLVLISALMAFLYRVKINDYFSNFYNGIKKMVKPVLCFLGVYMIFGAIYCSPFMATISNWAFNLTDGLNPYITSILAFVTSIFHIDFGYTGYTISQFVTTAYASNLSVVHCIYTSMYGLVQIIMPTSVVMLIGLGLMKVDYKSWFKYIWLFVVGMFAILLVLFTVLTYI